MKARLCIVLSAEISCMHFRHRQEVHANCNQSINQYLYLSVKLTAVEEPLNGGLPRGVLVSLCRLFSMQAVACFVGENVAVVFSLERQMSLSVFQFLRCRTVEKCPPIFTLTWLTLIKTAALIANCDTECRYCNYSSIQMSQMRFKESGCLPFTQKFRKFRSECKW